MNLLQIHLIGKHVKTSHIDLMSVTRYILSTLLNCIELLHKFRKSIESFYDVHEKIFVNEQGITARLSSLFIDTVVAS